MNLFTTLFTGLAGFGYRNSGRLIMGALVVLVCSPLLLDGLRVEADASKVIPYEDSLALTTARIGRCLVKRTAWLSSFVTAR